MASSTFAGHYKKLNAAQKQAVDAIDGPVMVIAGPGTGKTQILTLRIANILKRTDTPPDAILALTFTESGVAAMRRRLVSIIGAEAYRVGIFTFHSFCNEIIRRYPDAFPRIIGADPITDIRKIGILRDIIRASDFEHLKPFGDNFYYVNGLRQKISELKRENVGTDKLEAALDAAQKAFDATDDLYHEKGAHKGKMKSKYETEAKRLKRSRELLFVYRAYQEALAKERLYDFDDMIMEVVAALERDPELLLRVQEEYLYILADEHQDANEAQNRLLERIASFHDSPNLFVVGDEKQAIYRFQGASLDNFMYFKKLFPDVTLIELTDAYRSGQRILDAAHAMIGNAQSADARPRTALRSAAGVVHETVELHRFVSPAAERKWVVEHVRQKIEEGVEPSEIAVLYRTNGESDAWVRAFEDRGVAVSVESEQNALKDPDIRKLIVLLRALTRFGDDEAMASVLHLPFLGIAPLDAYKVIGEARRKRRAIAEVMGDEAALRGARVEDVSKVRALFAMLSRFASHEGSVPDAVSALVRESGFLTYILGSMRAVELVEKLAGLTRDIESLAAGDPEYTLQRLTDHLVLLDEYGIPVVKEVRAAPRKGAVRLMTAHKSKGLEFDYVYVVNAIDGTWGGRRNVTHFTLPTGGVSGDDDDERRLLYVALTRARLAVSLSFAEERDGKALLPSRFVEEIGHERLVEEHHADEHDHASDLARERAPASVLLPDRSFLNELFLEQGLSVTALNNYLACPWRYFYSNLIRIPMSPTPALLYGNAADAALKRYFEYYREHGSLDTELLVSWFKEEAARTSLLQKDLDSMVARGEEHLRAWHAAWETTFVRETKSGYRIEGELAPAGDLPKVLLRGELDKVEFLDDGSVRVVDYKTGKPKSRNAIMGNTKSEDGGYFRQLVFYRLLLGLEGKHRFRDAVLDFIQPDERGKLHREAFEITDEDEAALRETIQKTAGEIWNLVFWDSRCDKHAKGECEHCSLRDLMR